MIPEPGASRPSRTRRRRRAHINEVRYCYYQGLARDPNLRGTIKIGFTIRADGKVGPSEVRESTLDDPAVASCVTTAVLRATFPKPATPVSVVYPFELTPG